MKVLAVVGSPRKGGNTDVLVDRISQGARANGAEVEKVFLNDLDLRPCQACDACQTKNLYKGCVLKDDMPTVHRSLRECDALIIGTPVYWFGPSAQTKIFLDRWYCLVVPGEKTPDYALKGKRVALAITYGDVDPFTAGAANVYATIRDAATFAGAKIVGVAYGTGAEKGSIAGNQAAMEAAYELGRRLCLSGGGGLSPEGDGAKVTGA